MYLSLRDQYIFVRNTVYRYTCIFVWTSTITATEVADAVGNAERNVSMASTILVHHMTSFTPL